MLWQDAQEFGVPGPSCSSSLHRQVCMWQWPGDPGSGELWLDRRRLQHPWVQHLRGGLGVVGVH